MVYQSDIFLETTKLGLGHMHDNSYTETFKEICLKIFESQMYES